MDLLLPSQASATQWLQVLSVLKVMFPNHVAYKMLVLEGNKGMMGLPKNPLSLQFYMDMRLSTQAHRVGLLTSYPVAQSNCFLQASMHN